MTATLILGGARSGKSTYAERRALESGKAVCFVATASPGDEEMAARIAAHQAARPAEWRTLEAPAHVGKVIQQQYRGEAVILLDCITLLASNRLMELPEPVDEKGYLAALDGEVTALTEAIQRLPVEVWWIVSNEVGLGLVPEYPLGRVYRDGLGRLNQRLAQICDHVILMVAGLPLHVK